MNHIQETKIIKSNILVFLSLNDDIYFAFLAIADRVLILNYYFFHNKNKIYVLHLPFK